ncbi:MAG: hypothetical protein ABI405_05330 [Parafilimonas sp.]
MDESEELNEEEKLKAENDFLKMKIMLEHGSEFHSTDNTDELPADIENQFLKNIIEFEKQFEERKTITVFEKIGKPQQFKPVNEIEDVDMEAAWKALHEHISQYGVDLSVCSPKVSVRELYRFTTEELFEHEIDDMNLPGLTSGFIYDEFYPDYEYDNTNAAVDDCIKSILNKEPFEWMHHFTKDNITLNNYNALSQEEFKNIINRFKDAFDEIELNELNDINCLINENICNVEGTHSASGKFANELMQWNGKWNVQFEFDDEYGDWSINNVQIEGINF